jgi:hypothetical protein
VSDEQEVTPALYDHACRVYEEMVKRSSIEAMQIVEDPSTVTHDEAYKEVRVYEGHLTRLFSDLQIANPYYTKIRNALVDQNCIEQLRRGGGAAKSKWILHHEPDEETFKTIMERRHVGTRQQKGQILEQRVKDLTKMVSDLTERVEILEKV